MKVVRAAQRKAKVKKVSAVTQQMIADVIGLVAILASILATYLLWTTSK